MAALFPSLLLALAMVRITTATGVYNSSTTPSYLPWNTYNYCSAPHVNVQHYTKPKMSDVEIVYLNVVMRHHKRTPDNLYPDENALNPAAGWNCTDFLQYSFGYGGTVNNVESAHVYHETDTPAQHPFLSQIWNGTCDAGQLTRGGLDDSVKHGKDFWAVYHGKLGFLQAVDEQELYIRTSTETRTFQVAGGMLYGMNKELATKPFKVYTQPNVIDSLVPNYACPAAGDIRNAYQSVPAWDDHLQQNLDLQTRLGQTLGTLNDSSWNSWYDHYFDTFTSRTCHEHPLPCNATGTCVSRADADRVFAIGDFEYNYIWNAAQNASTYVQLTFGVMFGELAANMRSFQAGTETHRARLYVGHDGSMIRLAAGLGLGRHSPLRWPALGSEIIFEVWKQKGGGAKYVRVLHEGTPVEALEWIPLGDFVSLLESQVPSNIVQACSSG